MPAEESVPNQASTIYTRGSSNSCRTVIAVTLTALFAGTGGFLLGTRQNVPQNAEKIIHQLTPTIMQSSASALSPSSAQQARISVSLPDPIGKWETYPACREARFFADLSQAIKESESACGLDLEGNSLVRVPPHIYKLRNLKVLLLGSNNLAHVPSEIKTMKNLTDLTLDRNQLTDIPSWIGDLRSLQYLSVSFNRLTKVPPEIGKLSNLTILDLTGNPMTRDEVEKIRRSLPKTRVVFIRPMNLP
jgi:hypothetical protein